MEALFYFLLWAGLIFLMMRLGCGSHVTGHEGGRSGGSRASASRNTPRLRWVPPETDIDPVCGKEVHTDRAKPSVHGGMVYYFCSRDCRELFEVGPEQYLGSDSAQDEKVMDAAGG